MHSLWKRSMAISLVLAVTFALVLPLDAGAQGNSKANALTVPIAGTSTGANPTPFSGTLRITGFERSGNTILAVGTATIATAAGDGVAQAAVQQVKIPVKSINGFDLSGTGGAAALAQPQAGCDILNLVLGPLDLNLLGLTIHLDQVVLDIVAVPGPGNLLGNLLCAVANLLNGGLGLNALLTQQIGRASCRERV